jgi:hypothetical protein
MLIDREGKILWRRKAAAVADRPDPGEITAAIDEHCQP